MRICGNKLASMALVGFIGMAMAIGKNIIVFLTNQVFKIL